MLAHKYHTMPTAKFICMYAYIHEMKKQTYYAASYSTVSLSTHTNNILHVLGPANAQAARS